MTTSLCSATPILVIGAGTWGISTALHLARLGYENVTVLDEHVIPSLISAGNDINKILELGSDPSDTDDDESYVSNRLGQAATGGWRNDPVFKPFFHETGCVLAATTPKARKWLDEHEGPSEVTGWKSLKSKQDFRATMPDGVLTGDFPGWRGWFRKKDCGWVHARKAMEAAALEAQKLGVNFITGPEAGKVVSLSFTEDGDIGGATTADGKHHYAHHTILACGANAPQLLDMKNQLRPTAWTLAHIKMTTSETSACKDLPVLFNIERGFFMEPDSDNHELKICDEHPGYCNWIDKDKPDSRRSVPFARHQIPLDAENRVRSFLQETMPHLADRPFSFARICWCADTPDRQFLISRHPEHPSLVLAVGGSGHGYAHIPAIGGFIVDALEGKLDERMQRAFRWRPETAVGRDWESLQNRFGPEGSDRVMDLGQVEEWTDIGNGARL